MGTRAVFLALFALLLSSAGGTLQAQTVRGSVRNAATGQPIADASVVLLDRQGRIQRGTLTEPDGSYVLVAPGSGTYTLRAGGLGFVTKDSPPIELDADQDVEVGFMLTPEGGDLGALAVFERRRAGGEGVFLTRDDIEQRGGSRFTDLLLNIPGVTVLSLADLRQNVPDDSLMILSGYFTVRLAGSHFDVGAPGARHRLELKEDCPPVLFVDDRWWGSIDQAGLLGPDMELLPSDLVGIEIYNPSVVPDELDTGLESRCGVIAVWRKERG